MHFYSKQKVYNLVSAFCWFFFKCKISIFKRLAKITRKKHFFPFYMLTLDGVCGGKSLQLACKSKLKSIIGVVSFSRHQNSELKKLRICKKPHEMSSNRLQLGLPLLLLLSTRRGHTHSPSEIMTSSILSSSKPTNMQNRYAKAYESIEIIT